MKAPSSNWKSKCCYNVAPATTVARCCRYNNSATIGIVAIGKTLLQDLRELHPGRVRDSCMDNDRGLDAGIGKKVTLLLSFTDHRATDRGNNLAEGDSQ